MGLKPKTFNYYFIALFDKYLLQGYHVSGTVVSKENLVMTKTVLVTALAGVYSVGREMGFALITVVTVLGRRGEVTMELKDMETT